LAFIITEYLAHLQLRLGCVLVIHQAAPRVESALEG
jgi:hypothetical protein